MISNSESLQVDNLWNHGQVYESIKFTHMQSECIVQLISNTRWIGNSFRAASHCTNDKEIYLPWKYPLRRMRLRWHDNTYDVVTFVKTKFPDKVWRGVLQQHEWSLWYSVVQTFLVVKIQQENSGDFITFSREIPLTHLPNLNIHFPLALHENIYSENFNKG